MEPPYENHPTGPDTPRIDSHQVRKGAYWAMLAGAAGHGYGALDLFRSTRRVTGFPRRRLFALARGDSLRGFPAGRAHAPAVRAPALVSARSRPISYSLRPGEGEDHIQAARAEDRSFLIAYLPQGNPVGIHMGRISGRASRLGV